MKDTVLVIDDLPMLGQLKALEDKGVRLIVCSTCLDYYGVTNRVTIGIIESQVNAEKVITL